MESLPATIIEKTLNERLGDQNIVNQILSHYYKYLDYHFVYWKRNIKICLSEMYFKNIRYDRELFQDTVTKRVGMVVKGENYYWKEFYFETSIPVFNDILNERGEKNVSDFKNKMEFLKFMCYVSNGLKNKIENINWYSISADILREY